MGGGGGGLRGVLSPRLTLAPFPLETATCICTLYATLTLLCGESYAPHQIIKLHIAIFHPWFQTQKETPSSIYYYDVE